MKVVLRVGFDFMLNIKSEICLNLLLKRAGLHELTVKILLLKFHRLQNDIGYPAFQTKASHCIQESLVTFLQIPLPVVFVLCRKSIQMKKYY